VPAAAVIPAPVAYIKVVAFKTLVVETCSWAWQYLTLVRLMLVVHRESAYRKVVYSLS
jgi:hypothetical protein